MSDLPDILADYLPFEINGTEWRFSKINLGMMAVFETTMAMRQLQRALKALGADADHAERAEMIRTYRVGAGLGDVMATVYSAEGARLMLYLSMTPNHPDLTEEAVGRLITPGILPEMQGLLDRLTDSDALEEAGELSKNAPTVTAEAGPVSQPPSPRSTDSTAKRSAA